MTKFRTLIIELEIKPDNTSEDEILDTMYKALETKYGKWFVSTIDTLDIEEE